MPGSQPITLGPMPRAPTTAPMANSAVKWTFDPQRLQTSYSDLLESGMLSDAEVRCGGRTWKVHKAILCTRSEWFKKALTGSFKESRTGIVTIEICTANEAELLLRYLYTGVIDIEKYFPGETMTIPVVKVWKIADFFCLPELQRIALQVRDGLLKEMTENYGYLDYKSPKPSFSNSFIYCVIRNIRFLYTDNRLDILENFRLPYLAVLLLATGSLVKIREFRQLFRELPGFASDWALALSGCLGSLAEPIIHGPSQCAKCYAYPDTCRVNFVKWVKKRQVEVLCERCISAPTWKDWVR